MIVADIDLSIEFLQWWSPEGPWLLTAIPNDRQKIDPRSFTDLSAARDWLAEKSQQKWGIYFSVNPTRVVSAKAQASDVTHLSWIHVDLDPEDGEDIDKERARLLAAIQDKSNGLPEPSCIVYSGGGYWAFWRLEEPLPISDPEDAKLYNLQAELILGGDGCHNVDRIARLPGTINWPNQRKAAKGQVPALATVIDQNDKRYPLHAFTKAAVRQDSVSEVNGGTTATQVKVSGNVRRVLDLDELPQGTSSRAKVVIAQGKDHDQPLAGKDQTRSAWLHFVCCSLVRSGVDDDTIYAIITDPEWKISASVLDKGNSAQVHRYALRQIKQAKESIIDPALCHLNDRYALIESVGGRCRIAREGWNPSLDRHEVDFLLIDGFKQTFNNRRVDMGVDEKGNPRKPARMGSWWLEHPERRTYTDVVFYPGKEFDGALNLWRGFAYDAIPGDCSLYLDHIRKVLCKGNDEWADYLIRWMAYAVQNPHEPGHVAVVLRGKQGTGKGTFAQHFGALWGVHFKHVTKPDHITGQFNNLLKDASVLFADECFRTDKTHVSALKTLITEDTLRVEAKGVDNLETRNCTHVIMATNESWAVHAELDDRRFFILEVGDSHRKDAKYFRAIAKQMSNGGYQALLHYLLTLDLGEFNVRAAPRTDELAQQQQRSMKPEYALVFEMLEYGRIMPDHGTWTGEAMMDQLADRFLGMYDRRMTMHGAKVTLGMTVRRMLGVHKRRLRNETRRWVDSRGRENITENPWVWEFPPLAECRTMWDKEFGPRDWPEIDDNDQEESDAF